MQACNNTRLVYVQVAVLQAEATTTVCACIQRVLLRAYWNAVLLAVAQQAPRQVAARTVELLAMRQLFDEQSRSVVLVNNSCRCSAQQVLPLQIPNMHLSCKHAQDSNCASIVETAGFWQDAGNSPLQR
jgi:hypothetical protein